VWSAPTIDVERGAVYVATGNAYTGPAAETSDAVIAFDLKTGKLLWVNQVQSGDAYMISCDANARTRDNCPDVNGPDFDFGNSPILRRLPNRKSVLVVGQKSGAVWALDPDNKGATLWTHKVGRGSALGGLEWGSAVDEQVGYFPVSDAQFGPAQAGALYALRLENGQEVWHVDPPGANCTPAAGRTCTASRSAAITVIPGAVFSGTTDGMMRAYSTTDGKVLWEFNTAREFETVNGVPGKGGSINGPGPVIVDGMVFTNSGYAYLGTGMSGNVLLAFGR
jgi:polyvinyl alcohol dehydrogenase (cytochrome)